jgi:hypothetical protein
MGSGVLDAVQEVDVEDSRTGVVVSNEGSVVSAGGCSVAEVGSTAELEARAESTGAELTSSNVGSGVESWVDVTGAEDAASAADEDGVSAMGVAVDPTSSTDAGDVEAGAAGLAGVDDATGVDEEADVESPPEEDPSRLIQAKLISVTLLP